MIFITGGVRSGKSALAEKLALEGSAGVTYIATAEPGDAEMKARIDEHRRRRPPSWKTVEAIRGLPGAIRQALEGGGTVLVDCLTVYLSNLLTADPNNIVAGVAMVKLLSEEVEQVAAACRLENGSGKLIMVSNEVGLGIVPESPLGRFFRDAAGAANQKLAALADEVYLCVSGIPVRIK